MFIYECLNNSITFTAISSTPEVRHALKGFVRAAPEHLLEGHSIGSKQTKHLGMMDFKKCHQYRAPKIPVPSCCSGNGMTGK